MFKTLDTLRFRRPLSISHSSSFLASLANQKHTAVATYAAGTDQLSRRRSGAPRECSAPRRSGDRLATTCTTLNEPWAVPQIAEGRAPWSRTRDGTAGRPEGGAVPALGEEVGDQQAGHGDAKGAAAHRADPKGDGGEGAEHREFGMSAARWGAALLGPAEEEAEEEEVMRSATMPPPTAERVPPPATMSALKKEYWPAFAGKAER